ncbi:hypothetical protein [Mastigocoleus testarum]|uniref:DUF4870 domain-containing protein n=1 Tax=Mastigocoleus testarum BC008 TaxID=371196 RepID=A0A0V7ZI14_9CYAN|nr:hypothetical protein [Mastigocoleus testarum]KST63996.1 hypothetical protein BC008_40060 [Mastigocoleus testarum BC008]KST64706.1 hypothetical protein BC008_41035 [Mastigocoleus testarum BC008]
MNHTESANRTYNTNDTSYPSQYLLLYLIPVIGFFPSLWTLYRRQGSREKLSISRLSVTLALIWVVGYIFLASGTASFNSNLFAVRLLILNSFFTSSYFLVSIWLMLRISKNKYKGLPGFSQLADQILGKYLS